MENKTSFYDMDYNAMDRDLSPEQQREWTAIYASYRSRTPLTGTVIGVDTHRLAVRNPETGAMETRELQCLVLMDFRVKVIIPQPEIWYQADADMPDYVVRRMVGARIGYVITNVDREGECAIASRRMALGYARNRFFRDRLHSEPGRILQCNVLVVGPKRILVECNGFDISIRNRELSYTAIADLRSEYKPGQEISARLKAVDRQARSKFRSRRSIRTPTLAQKDATRSALRARQSSAGLTRAAYSAAFRTTRPAFACTRRIISKRNFTLAMPC